MRIEVYPTDAEAVDAAAALVAERLREGGAGRRARAAIAGGRPGRGLMVALAARGDLPWAHVDWYLADERCGPTGDPLAHAKVARESLFAPRGVPADRVHVPDLAPVTPDAIAAAYAAVLDQHLGPDGILDVAALALGGDARLGALPPGGGLLDAPGTVVVAPGSDGVPRITMTLSLLSRARHLIVTAVGPDAAGAVAAALRSATGPAGRVPPSARVTWIVDRAAAGTLLQDARPAAE